MQINFSDGYLLSTSCNIVISFLLTVLLFNSNEEIYVSIYNSCFYRARIKYSSLTLKYVYIIYKSSCQFQFYVYSFLEQTKTRLISATADSGFRVVDFEFMYKISPCPLPPSSNERFLFLILNRTSLAGFVQIRDRGPTTWNVVGIPNSPNSSLLAPLRHRSRFSDL